MQRYDIGEYDSGMYPHADGDWVRYSDAIDRIKDLEGTLKAILNAHEMGCVDWPAMRAAKMLLYS